MAVRGKGGADAVERDRHISGSRNRGRSNVHAADSSTDRVCRAESLQAVVITDVSMVRLLNRWWAAKIAASRAPPACRPPSQGQAQHPSVLRLAALPPEPTLPRASKPRPRLPVAKRISGMPLRRMPREERIVLMEPVEIIVGQPAQTRQGDIKRAPPPRPFRQYKSVIFFEMTSQYQHHRVQARTNCCSDARPWRDNACRSGGGGEHC